MGRIVIRYASSLRLRAERRDAAGDCIDFSPGAICARAKFLFGFAHFESCESCISGAPGCCRGMKSMTHVFINSVGTICETPLWRH